MKLNQTTFAEFLRWCKRPEMFPAISPAWRYVNEDQLRVIYNYMAKHDLECEGRLLTTRFKGEWLSSLSGCNPMEYEPTREDLAENMFHEVWCKTEWAVRCSIDKMALGYSSVLSEFGINTIKMLNKYRRNVA